ncbi:MAG: virulence protein RhuM/Fic/DOC family protein [Candidatus Magasanikbacteria bacterium]|nr:virulence protein RhuM/Fic/DOC family protein [Candidatus Magasanikbacteria bacterium]
MRKKNNNEIVIYQSSKGAIELKGDAKKETIWASLDQIAHVFGRDKSVISRHIKNIFKDKELNRNSVVAFFATTASDGKVYNVEYFNLDMILSVGYRVNSKQATFFRQWATKVLRDHITKGYTINPARIKKNYAEFLTAVDKVKALLPAHVKPDTESILELIKVFADTWLSLDAYDKEKFGKGKVTKKKVVLTAEKLLAAIGELKVELVKKSEATDIFAKERSSGSIEGIIGNVMQSFGGKELYPNIEEKAAHLLYFMVKNHPFIDGNKRSGAFSFVWFLRLSGVLDVSQLRPSALTALTILIAESNPKEKEKMVGLVAMLLRK